MHVHFIFSCFREVFKGENLSFRLRVKYSYCCSVPGAIQSQLQKLTAFFPCVLAALLTLIRLTHRKVEWKQSLKRLTDF